jgi:hypothetical protein
MTMSEPQRTDQEPGGASRDDILKALFAQMVLQQTNMAMLLLGKTPHPQTGRKMQDLEGARMFIDQLEMIEVKTRGNLSREEQALLKQSLLSLQLAFVEAVGTAPPSDARPTPEVPPTGAAPQHSPDAEASIPEAEARKKFSKKY